MGKDKMVAMILAGGRGSRLYDLTQHVAKPAVHFGGKYRIIDFTLSNCANSNIPTVGVLVQYESILLSSYASRSMTWGLDVSGGGVYVLPPREKNNTDFASYRGTADAITQNLDFLDQEEADYVLVVSGDHIYKMNYEKMLKRHIETKAEATIAVIDVPLKEASRFGIMNCDKEDHIVEFEEKPSNPKSTLASMGIYIFSYKALKEHLKRDDKNEASQHDFGKDIIPEYINEGLKVMAYRFKGYWKDVGTIESLWESNIDLLSEDNELNLFESDWKIYTEDENRCSQVIGRDAVIHKAFITQGCVVDGLLDNSVIFTGVKVEKNAELHDTVVMNNSVICEGAKLYRCLVADNVKVPAGFVVKESKSEGVTLVTNSYIKRAGEKNAK